MLERGPQNHVAEWLVEHRPLGERITPPLPQRDRPGHALRPARDRTVATCLRQPRAIAQIEQKTWARSRTATESRASPAIRRMIRWPAKKTAAERREDALRRFDRC